MNKHKEVMNESPTSKPAGITKDISPVDSLLKSFGLDPDD